MAELNTQGKMKKPSLQTLLLCGMGLSLALSIIRCQGYKDQVVKLSGQTPPQLASVNGLAVTPRPSRALEIKGMDNMEGLSIDRWVAKFHEAKMTLNGEALRRRQLELARLAVATLGCSNELIALRAELMETGEIRR